jgi:hypothetical protein
MSLAVYASLIFYYAVRTKKDPYRRYTYLPPDYTVFSYQSNHKTQNVLEEYLNIVPLS